MFHENIRVARNHRGLAARAVFAAGDIQPVATIVDEDNNGKKDDQDGRPGEHGPVDRTTTTSPDPKPTLSNKHVVPSAPDPAVASSVITPSTTAAASPTISTPVRPTTISTPVRPTTISTPVLPSSSSTPVLPTTITPSTATPLTSSSKSVSVKHLTVTVEKASSTSHAAITAKASPSAEPVASGAVSGGAVAGGVIGGLAGLALLIAMVFFVVRHYRRKSLDDLVFNASKFRRSALLLEDPLEKEKMQEKRGPRPPSMIARHFNAPAVPQASAASPYSEHAVQSTDPYGHYAAAAAQYNLGMYGADGQVTHDPYADIYSGNPASGQHASLGQPAFGAAPMQFQFPQRPYHQHQEYQSSSTPGAQASAAAVNAPLANPFSNATSALAAASTVAPAQTTSSDSSHTQSRDTTSKPEVLHRRPSTQSTSCPPAYADDPKYANIQRDVKVAPGTLAVVNNDNNASSSSASAASPANTNTTSASAPLTRANTQRPMSSYTIYNPEDAYGGM